MNTKHLEFCKQHDWGLNATLNADGSISNLVERLSSGTGPTFDIIVTMHTWAELSAWAGY